MCWLDIDRSVRWSRVERVKERSFVRKVEVYTRCIHIDERGGEKKGRIAEDRGGWERKAGEM